MDVLRVGSHGPNVKALQEALNTRLNPSPRLRPDSSFGSVTRAAVVRFQQENWLVVDGEVGPATWNAVMGLETYSPILHRLRFIPQPTPTTCWAASTAMVTGSSVPVVIARTPADLILPNGSLANYSGQDDWRSGTIRFANAHGLAFLGPTSWPPSALVSMLRSGPLIFDMLWQASDYAEGFGSSGHMIAVVGIRGDDDESGRGTSLRILDPWPPGKGKQYSVGYMRWVQEVPTRTYRIFHRR